MLPARFTSRTIFAALFIACAAMMGFGYYLQYALGLEPCPLCMTQRVFLVAVGLTAALAALHAPGARGVRIYAGLTLLFCITGAGFASRHLWLQSLPASQVPACGPSIDYILDTLPPLEALEVLLRGNGSCAEVVWRFLGLSIPGWTLLAFTAFAALAVWTAWRPHESE